MSSRQPDFMSAMSAVLGMANTFMQPRQEGINNLPYDVLESEKEIRIYVEMPGVAKRNLEIDVFNDQLKIQGKKEPYPLPADPEDDGYERHKIGINFADVKLSIRMPLAVTNRANLKVSLDQGILAIIIDKEAESKNSFKVSLED